MINLYTIKETARKNLSSKSGAFLTLALLAVAGILVVIALLPEHKLLKAGALVWTVLP